MIKYYCDRCGKEVENYKEIVMQFLGKYKAKGKEKEDPFNLPKILDNKVLLCSDCYKQTIKELNEVLRKIKAENKFIEEA